MTNKKKLSRANNVFLIIRGEKSEFHKAPFCPIILCSRRHTAEWESGNTEDGSTVLYNYSLTDEGNWILTKYKGYGIKSNGFIKLFDGNDSYGVSDRNHINELLKDAVWWSYDEIPTWLLQKGVKYPSDDFTKRLIVEDYGTCLMPHSKEMKYLESLENMIYPIG